MTNAEKIVRHALSRYVKVKDSSISRYAFQSEEKGVWIGEQVEVKDYFCLFEREHEIRTGIDRKRLEKYCATDKPFRLSFLQILDILQVNKYLYLSNERIAGVYLAEAQVLKEKVVDGSGEGYEMVYWNVKDLQYFYSMQDLMKDKAIADVVRTVRNEAKASCYDQLVYEHRIYKGRILV